MSLLSLNETCVPIYDISMYINTYQYTYIYINDIGILIYTHICTKKNAYMYIHIYIFVYTTYAYIQTYVKTYIYTYLVEIMHV